MGPCEAIDRSSCIYQWAHAIPSAAVAAYADWPTRNRRQQQLHILLGPNEAIGSTCWENKGPTRNHRATGAAYFDGPMRYHRQQQLHMPVGPRETIGNQLDVPTLVNY